MTTQQPHMTAQQSGGAPVPGGTDHRAPDATVRVRTARFGFTVATMIAVGLFVPGDITILLTGLVVFVPVAFAWPRLLGVHPPQGGFARNVGGIGLAATAYFGPQIARAVPDQMPWVIAACAALAGVFCYAITRDWQAPPSTSARA